MRTPPAILSLMTLAAAAGAWTLAAALALAGASGCDAGGGTSAASAAESPGAGTVAPPAAPPAAPPPATGTVKFERALPFSPRGFPSSISAATMDEFYKGMAPYGRYVTFHLNWRDGVAAAGKVPQAAQAARVHSTTYGVPVLVHFGWTVGETPDLTSDSDPATNTWANQETRREFREMVVLYAAQAKPPYFFLGNETNVWAAKTTPEEWARWISEFQECYDAVKAVSPDTVVFTTFQYERLLGLGKKNGWRGAAQGNLIASHGAKIDAIGFTTYPYFEYETPADVPADYYDRIAATWKGKVVFTEVGWVAAPDAPYTGSEKEQADFIPLFAQRVSRLNVGYATWLFMHDPTTVQPAFKMIGLRAADGTARPADAAWKALSGG